MGMQQIAFTVVLLVVAYMSFRLYGRVRSNILLGKEYKGAPDLGLRWKNVLLIAFGQKKMFRRWVPALLHLAIYLAFLITQIELVEIIVDGLLGGHRTFAGALSGFYPVIINVIEILSVLAFIATSIFLVRRNVVKLARFEKPEMSGWPRKDANLILLGELLLIVGIFTMNGADVLLQTMAPLHYPETGRLLISDGFGPAIFGGLSFETLTVIERSGWWLHVLVVFGFILYLPVSKHLHILLAFPNTYFARQEPPGLMQNMPKVMDEVKIMMGLKEETSSSDQAIPEFGAKDVTDLSWKNLLDAYTCTECGRCTSVCPANSTGKKLSPRKIMMDVRDRAEEVGRKIATGEAQYLRSGCEEQELSASTFSDEGSLFDSITTEELHACTTCNACVEACPVLINPMEVILEMRRYEILTLGAGPSDWLPMFTSLENSGSVWQVNTERDDWLKL